jgi:hypothetical protein
VFLQVDYLSIVFLPSRLGTLSRKSSMSTDIF